MPNLTSVGLTAGVPTSGTGTVGTIDNVTGTAGTPSTAVLTVQGVASGTAQPVSGTVTANVQLAGTTPDVGTGTGGSKTQRVIVDSSQMGSLGQAAMAASVPVAIASDQAAVNVKGSGTAGTANSGVVTVQGIASMTKLLVTPDSVALPANQSVNIAQIAGATTPVGSGVQATAMRTTLATDSPGIVTLGGATPANSVPTVHAAYTYAHISTSATTTVKSGAGMLHTLTVNNLGTVASTTTVYDNTAGSGTVIAVINTLAGQISYIYDIAFATGLTLVTTGTVAPDITVSYR